MNRTALKNYAPQARRDFIQAMTDRAAHYGITASKVEPLVLRGDAVVIAGKEFPKAVAAKRSSLEERIKRDGFGPTMEVIAYTWFNRLAALRYMELHEYLEHGYQVLSHPDGKASPEVLEHAQHLDLPGLNRDEVIDLKMAGDREGDLYRLILLAQCNALHQAMPFLFERIDDETELLLPENLLNSDSIIRKLVEGIAEEDWQEVEIIGWLYQFYISERKDEVIGKVVASEDIPAATQLFTPNWIVKYLVQNTLGRQWLATYPASPLRQQMEYYIEPAEQTPEVQEQLKAITPSSLNPEEITFLDPACGSGHILVEAYDLFKAIYQERGYRAKDIPALILGKNLYGLEIDDRAAQLASLALMMKAREDDRRILDSQTKPHIVAFQNSVGLDADEITQALNAPVGNDSPPKEYLFEEIQEEKDGLFSKKALAQQGQVSKAEVAVLLELFQNAKTFGSLIQIPPNLASKLPEIEKRLGEVSKSGELGGKLAEGLKPILHQAQLLAQKYDAVVANPPYMGSKYLNPKLKEFLKKSYLGFEKDLFSSFIVRDVAFTKHEGNMGFMSPFVWMFISSYEELRSFVIDQSTITTLIQLEYSGFDGATVPICTFTLAKSHAVGTKGSFIKLSDFKGADQQAPKTLEAIRNKKCGWFYEAKPEDFKNIPGSPIAYWVSNRIRQAFENGIPLGSIAEPRQGMATTDNKQFLRLWHEVNIRGIGFNCLDTLAALKSGKRWFPYNKGGSFRKWYGNNNFVVDYENDGKRLKDIVKAKYRDKDYAQGFTDERWDKLIEVWVLKNQQFYFQPSITWSFVSSAYFGVRQSDLGFIFDVGGSSAFPAQDRRSEITAFMCSNVAFQCMKVLNPTLNFQVENVASLPFLVEQIDQQQLRISTIANEAISISRKDWNAAETSWDFITLPVCLHKQATLHASQQVADVECNVRFSAMKELEEENNRLFIEAYGLQDELSPDVPDDQITLYRPDREEDIKRLLSHAIGCMMGRYSLDKPGLIYAHAGNEGFDPSQYTNFPADDDGIVPLLNHDWAIDDDATSRLVQFIKVAWPEEHLEENLRFIADSLGGNSEEPARDVIRDYYSTGFFKHHLQMYKRRPIYWLFTSGKQRAFQCLVYLHRYKEGTLARMRTEYVIPLQGKIAGRIDQLEGDKLKATSTSHRKKLQKEQDDLKKQQKELTDFDEKLKHHADRRIKLDLDDGVKVNYAKFADLLAEVKAVTGGVEE
jgi:type II restriction/modification system DNA methylase subunit YeeA